MIDRRNFVPALISSLGVFVGTAAFLPHRGSFSFTGELDYFFKSRDHWELPFLLGAATFLFLLGVVGLLRPARDGGAH